MSKGLPTQCVLVDDCDFYGWFIYTGNNVVPDSPKQTLEAFVKEEECGLDQKGNVVKGRNTINLIHFSSRYFIKHRIKFIFLSCF